MPVKIQTTEFCSRLETDTDIKCIKIAKQNSFLVFSSWKQDMTTFFTWTSKKSSVSKKMTYINLSSKISSGLLLGILYQKWIQRFLLGKYNETKQTNWHHSFTRCLSTLGLFLSLIVVQLLAWFYSNKTTLQSLKESCIMDGVYLSICNGPAMSPQNPPVNSV